MAIKNMATQVVLFHEDALMGEYLERSIMGLRNIEVTDTGNNFPVILEHIMQTVPDIVVFSVHNSLSHLRSIETTLTISPRTKILLVTAFIHAIVMNAILQIGAVNYINVKKATIADMERAIMQVAENRSYRDASLDALWHDRLPKNTFLTNREQDVFWLLTMGSTNGEIANSLGLSEETVKTHCSHILGKLGLFDRNDIIYIATSGELPVGDHMPKKKSST